ncbi:MAG: S-layer homology domain-containing protein, partial [Clostridia bacterium]|nr:S-layer homology domain-containing protein [Clostridia bacterium]
WTLQLEEPWTVGTHTVTGSLLGASDTFQVTITESPIASIDIKDVTIIEHTNGYTVAYDTDDTYYYSPKLSATITFKDGSTQDINDYLVLEDDWYWLVTNMSSLQEEQPWAIGTYTATGSLLGANDTFQITIAKSPVASIEIQDLSVMEYSNGYSSNGTFYYKPSVTATITFKDGTKKENAEGFEFSGIWYGLETNMADIQYDQPWSVGTYAVTASLLDAQDTFRVTVHSQNLPTMNFADVGNNDWFASYISYAVVNGLFKGTSATTFEPHENITRAQLVQALANLSKVDTSNPNVATPFTDVPAGMWYSPAIRWAVENGIVSGMGDGTFQPNTPITREQMCLMLVNYVEKYQKNELYALADVLSFEDDATISSWAKEAVYKCAKSKLINGMGDGTFNPQGTAIRAQGATLFSNFHKYLTTEVFPVSPTKIKNRTYKLLQPGQFSEGEFSYSSLEITTFAISNMAGSIYSTDSFFYLESTFCDPTDHAELHNPIKYNGKEYCMVGVRGGESEFCISDNRIIFSGIELELLSNDTLRVVAVSDNSYWEVSPGDIFA